MPKFCPLIPQIYNPPPKVSAHSLTLTLPPHQVSVATCCYVDMYEYVAHTYPCTVDKFSHSFMLFDLIYFSFLNITFFKISIDFAAKVKSIVSKEMYRTGVYLL